MHYGVANIWPAKGLGDSLSSLCEATYKVRQNMTKWEANTRYALLVVFVQRKYFCRLYFSSIWCIVCLYIGIKPHEILWLVLLSLGEGG